MRGCKTVGVVIPAFEVSEWLPGVVRAIPEFVDHVAIVDDCSRDDTRTVAQGLASGDPRVHVIAREHNGGVGAAMKAGYRFLLSLGCEVLVKVDGDGQMDPRQMDSLVDPLVDGWADYAKGSRLSTRADIGAMPFHRLLGSIALTVLTKAASGYWQMLDPQNGYVAVTSATLEQLDMDRIDDRYFFENSMLIGLNITRARCMDVHMPAAYGGESSSMSIGRVMLDFPPKLLRGFCRRMLKRHLVVDFSPVFPLFTAGLMLLIAGATWGGYHWWLSAQTGVVATTGTVMLAVLPIFVGLQMLLQALVMDIENSRDLAISEDTYQRDKRGRATR